MDILSIIDMGTLATLTTAGLTIASSILGVKYAKYSKIVKQLIDMAEDGNITKEELQKFAKIIKNF